MIDVLVLIVTICAALAALLFGVHLYRNRGLVGELVYGDNMGDEVRTLRSYRYGLKGKPDALFKTPKGMVVIERKSGTPPRSGRPYDGDLIQAMTYCVLVEDEYGQAPLGARVEYANGAFDTRYTPKWKERVLEVAGAVRAGRQAIDVRRSHRDAFKCRNCGQRASCGETL